MQSNPTTTTHASLPLFPSPVSLDEIASAARRKANEAASAAREAREAKLTGDELERHVDAEVDAAHEADLAAARVSLARLRDQAAADAATAASAEDAATQARAAYAEARNDAAFKRFESAQREGAKARVLADSLAAQVAAEERAISEREAAHRIAVTERESKRAAREEHRRTTREGFLARYDAAKARLSDDATIERMRPFVGPLCAVLDQLARVAPNFWAVEGEANEARDELTTCAVGLGRTNDDAFTVEPIRRMTFRTASVARAFLAGELAKHCAERGIDPAVVQALAIAPR